MRLALYQPDIPQNTGTMLRLAACLGVAVDVIGPAGFDMTDRALRRASLDYLEHVAIVRHISFEAFANARLQGGQLERRQDARLEGGQPERQHDTTSRLILLTTQGSVAHHAFAFQPDDTLLVGRESAGVPEAVHGVADARVRVPMRPGLRSLNVAVAASIVLGEALRQTGRWPEFG